jgi:ABC-type glycerol-3-phosphate transport system substrate-binding protein
MLLAATVVAPRAHAAGPDQLSIWINWADAPVLKAFHGLSPGYKPSHPGVHWSVVSAVSEDKFVAAITAGTPPDVSMLGTTYYVGSLAASGAALDLQPYISKSRLNLNDFTSAALTSVSAFGHQYAMPFLEDTYMLYYNKKLFAQAGISGPPRTLSELTADARKLTISGSNGQYTQMGFVPSFFRGIWGIAYGGRFANAANTQITPLDPGVKASVQWMADYYASYGPDKVDRFDSAVGGYATALDPFVTGKVAMEVAGEYLQPTLAQYDPSLQYGVAPIPYADGQPSAANPGSVGGNPLVIPRGAKDPQASWNLIDWLETTGTRLTVKRFYVADMQAVPQLKSIVYDPSLAPSATMAAFWRYSASKNIVPWPSVAVSLEYVNAMNAAVDKIVHGQATVQAGLAAVQQQVQPQLSQALQQAHAG